MRKEPGGRADFSAVTDEAANMRERGESIRERFEATGLGYREWHAMTGVDRKTLHRAMAGTARENTCLVVETWLDRIEARNEGRPVALPTGAQVEEQSPGMVRIRLEGVFGAEAAVVEAPVDNPDALAAALDIIMRRLQGDKAASDEASETES